MRTWRSVWLHIEMQNPQPLAALAVVDTHKLSPTTVSYTFGEAQMGVVRIGADQLSTAGRIWTGLAVVAVEIGWLRWLERKKVNSEREAKELCLCDC